VFRQDRINTDMSFIKINQKGAATILLTVLLLSVFSTITFAIFVPILKQVRMSRSMEQSVIALYAADAGAEECLYRIKKDASSPCYMGASPCQLEVNLNLNNGSVPSYLVEFNGSDAIRSKGKFLSTVRRFKVDPMID